MERLYIELEIAFNESTYDLIYNTLYVNGLNSILEENGTVKVYLPEGESAHAEGIKTELLKSGLIKEKDISIEDYANQDWNKEWEKTIEPIYIAERLVIYPSWKRNDIDTTKDFIPIEIDPKMSFGTGHNETTRLILDQMCRYITPLADKYMLDFGSGTGILSIAAIKLGVERVVAIEIDDDSIENAKEYFEINRVTDQITLHQLDINQITESGFDVIAANITSNVIIPNLSVIYSKLKPGGKLFITGILKEEAEELINHLTKNNFVMRELKQQAEWSAFYCLKK
ncbi:MAG: 50S ribosomal protein L11 methyltransferase [Ignavibacteria bacterium]|nr:50S ribosomal protein L11 methyltransferase [Ignavibacteria bacterium]MCC7157985.1 50S ribosomal protein L11 methyltransferase [Ignavibacteria bacterium]